MIRWKFFVFCLMCRVYNLNATLYYETPNLDDQFENFQITDGIPVNGTGIGRINQARLTLFLRNFVTFNFKGKGNALLYFKGDPHVQNNSFTVEIGGGTNNDRVAIYKLKPYNKQPLTQKRVINITDEIESRSYWIFWDKNIQSVSVGVCTDPDEKEILQYSPLFDYSIREIYLSTSSANTGSWEFASDNQLFGGCDPLVPFGCPCDKGNGSKTFSTCTKSDATSGSVTGICPEICGNFGVLCASTTGCQGRSCQAAITSATPKNISPGTTTATPVSLFATTKLSNSFLPSSPTTITTPLSTEISTEFKFTTTNVTVTYATTILLHFTVYTASFISSVKMQYSGQSFDSSLFTHKHKAAAIVAAGLVASLGAAILIYALVSRCRCRVSSVFPAALCATGHDEENENDRPSRQRD